MDNKFPKGKIIIYLLCAAGTVILLMISVFSLGWFTNNRSTGSKMNGLRATDSNFELGAVDSSGKYDTYLEAENGNILSNISTENLLQKIDPISTGNGKNEIKWAMSSESNFGNYSGQNSDNGIQPGSSGKLTFYVIAKQNTDLDITFSLETILYNSSAKPIDESNTDNLDCIIPETEPEARLVKGHILFFEQYDKTSKLYSHRIDGNSFNFKKQNAKADTAYKVDIYWVWPVVVDQLILPENDSCFDGKDHQKIISDADSTALKTEMTGEPDKYFSRNDLTGLSEMLDNVSKGSGDSGFNIEYYNLLNDIWNEADQCIGSKIGYIEVKLTADEL